MEKDLWQRWRRREWWVEEGEVPPVGRRWRYSSGSLVLFCWTWAQLVELEAALTEPSPTRAHTWGQGSVRQAYYRYIRQRECVYKEGVCVVCVQPADWQSPERLSICPASLSSHSPLHPGRHGPPSSDASPLRSEKHITNVQFSTVKTLGCPSSFPKAVSGTVGWLCGGFKACCCVRVRVMTA